MGEGRTLCGPSRKNISTSDSSSPAPPPGTPLLCLAASWVHQRLPRGAPDAVPWWLWRGWVNSCCQAGGRAQWRLSPGTSGVLATWWAL